MEYSFYPWYSELSDFKWDRWGLLSFWAAIRRTLMINVPFFQCGNTLGFLKVLLLFVIYPFPEFLITFLPLFLHISPSEFSLYSIFWNLHILFILHTLICIVYFSILYSYPLSLLQNAVVFFTFYKCNFFLDLSKHNDVFLSHIFLSLHCFLHLADFVVCLELLLHAPGFLQTSRNLGLPVHI